MTTRTTPPPFALLAVLGGRAGCAAAAAAMPRRRAAPRLGAALRRLVADDPRARDLRRLADLDPHLLSDVGLTRAQVLAALDRR